MESDAQLSATIDASVWKRLPKVLLHEHIDGGLRPSTLFELCQRKGMDLPAPDASALGRWMQANADSGSLEQYLAGFALTVAAMASAEACERVAFEAAEDARLDGCVLAEFRIAPLLLESYGMSGDDVVEALVRGLRKSSLSSGLIVCAMRTDRPSETWRAAQLAARHAHQGVVGFDLAGAERGFPPLDHAEAFTAAGDAGLGITCHAGESDIGARVLEAASLGASRIGHGVNIMKGDAHEVANRIAEARDRGLHFEVCPTSNVHTGAYPSLAEHPIRAMFEAGLSVSCSTDNRLMSGVTLSGELMAIHDALGVTLAEARQMMVNGAAASFLSAEARHAAMEAISHGVD